MKSRSPASLFFFFFNDTATTEIYTLSLHDALPISRHTKLSGWPHFAQVAVLLISPPFPGPHGEPLFRRALRNPAGEPVAVDPASSSHAETPASECNNP